MNGPVPTGFRLKSAPYFFAAVGEIGANTSNAASRRNGAYGSLKLTFAVCSSRTSQDLYGPSVPRDTLAWVSGLMIRSNVKHTAAALNAVPSWNLTSRRSVKMYDS